MTSNESGEEENRELQEILNENNIAKRRSRKEGCDGQDMQCGARILY